MVLKCYEKLKPNLFTHAEDIDMNVYIYIKRAQEDAHTNSLLYGGALTSLESTALSMMGTQPLKVAVWKRQM